MRSALFRLPRWAAAALAGWLAVSAPARAASSVILSEFMAVNSNTLTDEDHDYSSWIELYNAGTTTVDLAGWRLTDNSNNLSKWTFPSTNIAPGGFVLVFASDKNRASSGSELHTNFKLKSSGEYLALTKPGGDIATAYAPEYPPQVPDVSFGIAPGSITNLLIETNAPCRYLVPSNDGLGYDWLDPDFNDDAWTNGWLGVGYDNVPPEYPPDYRPDIRSNVSNIMFNANGTIYIRIPFVVAKPEDLDALDLHMKFDDGFVAFLNGEEIASANDQDVNTWNSLATVLNDGADFAGYHVPNAEEYLRLGTNVLAIHGLNQSANSSDFLILPRLLATEKPSIENGLRRYFQLPTPLATNSAGVEQLGPPIFGVSHTPARPMPSEDLMVQARIPQTAAGLATATLSYVVMFTNAVTIPLLPSTGDIFSAAIPASSYSTGQMIRYFVSAVGTNGVTNRWPLAEDTAQWLGTVAQDPSVTTSLRVFEWFVQNTNWHVKVGGGNNLNATNVFVYFDGQFYDGAFARVRGNSSQNWRKPHFKFEFSKGHYFNWATNQEAVEEFNLQSAYSDKTYIRQILAMETYRDAGAPYCETMPVQVRQNGNFYSVAVWMEQPGERYLRRQGLSDRGALYKMFNTFTSSSSGVEKKTRQDEPNTDLQAIVAGVATNLTPSAREKSLFDNADLPALLNYIAATTIIHDNDHIAKNYYAYRDTEGDRDWTLLPWDKDLTFGRNYTTNNGGVLNDTIWADKDVIPAPTNRSPSHPLFGDSNHQKSDSGFNRLIDAVHKTPVIREMYLRRLRTLMDQLLQTNGAPAGELRYESRIAQLYTNLAPDVLLDRARWGNPYGSNQTFEAALALLTNQYLSVRRTHLFQTHSGPLGTNGVGIPRAQLESPQLQFGVIEFSPANSNQAQEYIELRNTNAVAVDLSGWSVSNAVKFTFEPGTVVAARSNLFLSPNLPAFRARPVSPRSNESRMVVGPYKGNLSARGGALELRDAGGAGIASTNFAGNPGALLDQLRITEIMYHPSGDGDQEFIELKNIGTNAIHLAGVQFTDGISFAFTNYTLAPSGLVAVVRNMAAFTNGYDPAGLPIAGVYSGALDNAGEKITLLDPRNEVILSFKYSPWYPETDGGGYSLTIVNPLAPFDSWGESNSWRASAVFRGTPGREEPTLPLDAVVINELLSHSDIYPDWVELRNTTTNSISIGGWLLSDSPAKLGKYIIPTGTVLNAGGYFVIAESEFNNPTNPACIVPFVFSELGEEVHLSSASNGVPGDYHVMFEFGAAERYVPFGRHATSDGRVLFVPMESATPGATNSPPRVGPIVISEIMYLPRSNGYEFIELRNLSNSVVPLYDPARPTNRWKLTSAVSYTFPTNRSLAPNGYALVVSTDPSQFRAAYDLPASIPIFGPFTGKLDKAGESIRLRKPLDPETNGVAPYAIADQVDFRGIAPWPVAPNGGGYSIEKTTNAAFGNDPAAWRLGNLLGSPGTVPQLDENQDGIPDNWQLLHFLTTNAVGYGDWDYDGIRNDEEYIYGSQPTNAASGSRLSISNIGSSVFVFIPTFAASGPGYFGIERRYALESATQLAGPWATASTWVGQSGTNVFAESGSDTTLFYRVRAWLQEPGAP